MLTLGIDGGTNSLGWALIREESGKTVLIGKGVHIFQEGVKYEKGNEQSRAAERTRYRNARCLLRRRRYRKIETLKVLTDNRLCPPLDNGELLLWKNKKQYPLNPDFLEWQQTDDNENRNPYHYRYLCLQRKLDLEKEAERYILGRALYHLAQRRGFLSNRLESTKESEGAVHTGISELTRAIREAGYHYPGEYFYHCYRHGIKIRKHYTARKEHYLAEFKAICRKQELSAGLEEALERALFFQRPLKSQKGSVGKCTFERNKPRCPVSHPDYEEYRMLCFLNNIRIQKPQDANMRPLHEDERRSIRPLFFRKSKANFPFEDIARKLSGKSPYKHKDDPYFPESDILFNYQMDTTVSGCPTIASLKGIGGEEWEEKFYLSYRCKETALGIKSPQDVIHDIWHVLFTFDSAEKLAGFARERMGQNEQAEAFASIILKQGYASLSLKAIRKILPWLRQGLLYPHATFLANMGEVLPPDIWQSPEDRAFISEQIYRIIRENQEKKTIVQIVNGLLSTCRDNQFSWEDNPVQTESYREMLQQHLEKFYGKNKWGSFPEIRKKDIREAAFALFRQQMQLNLNRGTFLNHTRIDEEICEFLAEHFHISARNLEKMYHPSDTEIYKPACSKTGKIRMGSPRIAAMKNPMAMRSLFRLRRLLNELLDKGLIDKDTRIQIELSRDLNDSNKRQALRSWQKQREKERSNYREEIKKIYKEQCHKDIEPSEAEILKYQLWTEQNGICLYTGQKIGICDFIGAAPRFDLEHTLPRSRSYDNSQENLTLCDARCNRDFKKNKIPSELPGHSSILMRVENWKEKYIQLERRIADYHRRSRNATGKEEKDSAIRQKHLLTAERDHWKGKYERFTMKDVPEGFKNSQLVDNGIIGKYARLYLKTVFPHVYTVKGSAVAEFRKIWGLQEEYTQKERTSHTHHCLDAITIACIRKKDYEALARYYHEWEQWEQQRGELRPSFKKPWKTFTEDLKKMPEEILVSHYTPDILPKQDRKKLRIKGQIVRDAEGNPLLQQGDSVRGCLHQETNYGAIKRLVTNKKGEAEECIRYVVRKAIDNLAGKDIENIVDDAVKSKIRKVWEEKGSLAEGIWMNEEKQIPIKSVRCYASNITNPIALKPHRDQSAKEYKQFNYVANDSNYLMAIYEGFNPKGKSKRDFRLINNLEAGQFYRQSQYNRQNCIVPFTHPDSGYELSKILKTGTMVIFWEKSPEEVWGLDVCDIRKRLYKVVGLSEQTIQKKYHYGTIALKFHQEARPASDLKITDGDFKSEDPYFPCRKMNHNQFNALVEGFDFKINILGEIEKIV